MTFVIVNSTFIYSNQPRPRLQTELLIITKLTSDHVRTESYRKSWFTVVV